MTKQNMIAIYLDENLEQKIKEASKKVGLNSSSFCRMTIIEKINLLEVSE